MKTDLFTDFLFVILLTVVFIVSLWVIDISLAGLIVNRPLVSILGIDVDPNFSYHTGLLVATICFLLMVTLFFFFKFKIFIEEIEDAFDKP